MRNAVLVTLLVLASIGVGLVSYYWLGHSDAIDDGPPLARLADRLIRNGEGGDGLGEGRAAMLLAVEDPGFYAHQGVDMDTPGGGMTTLTQSLAKRMAFNHFQPGVAKIRQTGYARGLEETLSKRQILALWLETVEMGRDRSGWMKGFYAASRIVYHKPPAELTDHEFLRLVAVVIAPGRFHLEGRDPALAERVARIERLLAGACAPRGNGDVWLRGCALT